MSNDNRVSEVRVSQEESGLKRRMFIFKATQVVWLFAGILLAMIALRVFLKILGANPESLIASLIYGFTDLFLFPFTGLINSPTTGNMVFELSSLFAILIYGLIAWGVGKAIWLIFYRPRGSVADVTETTTSEPPL